VTTSSSEFGHSGGKNDLVIPSGSSTSRVATGARFTAPGGHGTDAAKGRHAEGETIT
jgi:hypothetical protein